MFLVVHLGYSQVNYINQQSPTDSSTTIVKKKHTVKSTLVSIATLKPITSMSKPGKAALLSMLVPGLGQAYNKSFWKIPLVYAAIGGSAYATYWSRLEFKRVDYVFTLKKNPKLLIDNHAYDWAKIDTATAHNQTYANYSLTSLEKTTTYYRDMRDRFAMITVFLYVANIVEAHVDAHLKDFNVSEDVALRIRPSFTPTATGMRSNLDLNFYFTNNNKKHEHSTDRLW
jgi:hypothetical protein